MSTGDLKKELESKGVVTPGEFAHLVAVSRYQTPLKAPSIIRKGVGQLSAANADAFIRQYINPEYDVKKYDEARKFQEGLGDKTPNKPGGILLAAGTAAGHINQLQEAETALQNNDTVALNNISLIK